MPKPGKKDSAYVGDPQRCEICGTNLTLYPKDFAACPHCQRKVCRQCWGGAWAEKAFTPEVCSHLAQNDGLAMASVSGPKRGMDFDWPRALFMLILASLAIVTIVYLLSLFVF